jgi:hypothetical protein
MPYRVVDELLHHALRVVNDVVRDRPGEPDGRDKRNRTLDRPTIIAELYSARDPLWTKVRISVGTVHVVDHQDVAGHARGCQCRSEPRICPYHYHSRFGPPSRPDERVREESWRSVASESQPGGIDNDHPRLAQFSRESAGEMRIVAAGENAAECYGNTFRVSLVRCEILQDDHG